MPDTTEHGGGGISNHLLCHHLDAPNWDLAEDGGEGSSRMFTGCPITLVALLVAVFAVNWTLRLFSFCELT
jgi:hypothetical protein